MLIFHPGVSMTLTFGSHGKFLPRHFAPFLFKWLESIDLPSDFPVLLIVLWVEIASSSRYCVHSGQHCLWSIRVVYLFSIDFPMQLSIQHELCAVLEQFLLCWYIQCQQLSNISQSLCDMVSIDDQYSMHLSNWHSESSTQRRLRLWITRECIELLRQRSDPSLSVRTNLYDGPVSHSCNHLDSHYEHHYTKQWIQWVSRTLSIRQERDFWCNL